MKSPVIKVTKQTGMNPIARAVAKQRLIDSVLAYRVSVYLMDEGEQAQSDYTTMALVFAATMQGMSDLSGVDYRKLKAGLSVCAQAALRDWSWRLDDVVTLDNALGIVVEVFPKLPPQVASKAIQSVIGK